MFFLENRKKEVMLRKVKLRNEWGELETRRVQLSPSSRNLADELEIDRGLIEIERGRSDE